MTETHGIGGRQPRHFWRRGFAFLLDMLVAQLVVALLFSAFNAVTGISLGEMAFSNSQTECSAAPAGHPQVVRIDAMWPLPQGSRRESVICRHTDNSEESQTFTTRVVRTEGSTTYTREVFYPIDKDGQALPSEYERDFTSFAIVLFFVVLAANGRRTPGKAVMSLRIVTADGGVPGWGDAFRRECLKLLPLLVFAAVQLWLALAPPAMFTDSEVAIVAIRDGNLLTAPWTLLAAGLGAGSFVWWFGPFFAWRGRTWYDALAGTRLVRADRPALTAPRQP